MFNYVAIKIGSTNLGNARIAFILSLGSDLLFRFYPRTDNPEITQKPLIAGA